MINSRLPRPAGQQLERVGDARCAAGQNHDAVGVAIGLDLLAGQQPGENGKARDQRTTPKAASLRPIDLIRRLFTAVLRLTIVARPSRQSVVENAHPTRRNYNRDFGGKLNLLPALIR